MKADLDFTRVRVGLDRFIRREAMGEASWRFTTAGILLTAIAVFILLQMIRVQLSPEANFFRHRGELYSGAWKKMEPVRGHIYDRWGHLLAGNTTVYEISAQLDQVRNPTTIALAVSTVTGEDYDRLFVAASQPYSPTVSVQAVLADFVTEEEVAKLQKLAADWRDANINNDDPQAPSLAGLVYTPHLQRSYPEKSLAANVMGFVNREGKGYFGVEDYYNDLLAGASRKVWIPSDPHRATELPTTPEGASLILTIDRAIQAEVERILDDALREHGAEGGTLVVMDPRNGELLAIATTPRLDVNEYWRYGEFFQDTTPFNSAVSATYEPGSVFKVLTMAAGLDSGKVTPETTYLDVGYFEIGGSIIRNWGDTVWGPQTMLGCLQHSINTCLAWVGSQLGTSQFYDYMRRFGMGRLTGIDLGLEEGGHLKRPGDSDWYEVDLGANSFGQGISVTPVQMLMAVSAIANDGKMVTPHVVRAMIDKGRQYEITPRIAGMPITAETAHTLTEMLVQSLEVESSRALVEGYRVAGKTGTAEIPTLTGYTSWQTNASFVGWGPADDPHFLIYVWLEKPTSSIWGSDVASPVFREMVERLVIMLDLPPDAVRQTLTESQ
jgi:cell division protein FtsI/penicillin-binding protein 2